jgi:polysaccharide biosynthesis protein VpsJ
VELRPGPDARRGAILTTTVDESVAAIRVWGESRDWRGYDPYDGLNSPLAPVLSFGTTLGRRLLTQAVKHSPLNLRPLLGIRREWNAKAIGLVAAGYVRTAAARGDEDARGAAERWLDWLEGSAVSGNGAAWGYHFPVQTRVFRYARGAPNTIATAFVAHAFLDAIELIGSERDEIVRLVTRYLGSQRTEGPEGPYFRYLPNEGELVHNANLLACGVLARAAAILEDGAIADGVEEAVATTLAAQRGDGSWPYADAAGHDWVDNFHTGYVLESLAQCERMVPAVAAPLARGVAFWHEQLFLPDGTPKYTPSSVYPLDAHCYAQAIETWLAVPGHDGVVRAERLATLLIRDFLHPRGFVRFQRHRYWTNSVPFVRWTTAPAFRALAGLMLARVRHGGSE